MALRVFTTIWRPRFVDAIAEVVVVAGVVIGLALGFAFLPADISDVSGGFIAGGVIVGGLLLLLARGVLSRTLLRPGVFQGRATVGHDGVGVTRRRTQVFVSYANIANVRVDRFKREVVLESKDGDGVAFRVAKPNEVAAEITRRLEEARQRDATRPVPSLGDRRDDADGWIERARLLLSGGFRDGAVTAEHLADLAADPGAAPEQRIGAALALHDAPPPVRLRVCAAAHEVARPQLGEALIQAVEGEVDEELLARAFGS